MKTIFTFLSIFAVSMYCKAQSTYNAASYAAIGDTVYLTSAQIDTTNYIKGGAGYTWNFKALKGTSQQTLAFRNPKSTGFTQLQWPYIYNTANVNLSSTNGQSVALGQLEETNNNDYYLISTGALAEKASSFNIAYSSVALNIKNTYTTADTFYKFPLAYTDTFASTAQYTTSLPEVYYNMQTLLRTNKVDGWGTVITPYGTFTHCLRVVSDVVQANTFAISGVGLPKDTIQYRELKWLDSTKNYPVLYVKQTLAAGTYVTSQVQYYDVKQYFQPQALFAYVPLLPVVNDTVTFQNLSTNSTANEWNFGDGSISDEINPQHVFTPAGTYAVQLVAYNGTLTDTLVINIKVSSTTLPIQLVSFTGTKQKAENVLQWTTATETNAAYFGVERSLDGLSFSNIGTVAAAGNSTTIHNYSFDDAATTQGDIYYRLKVVDEDGHFTYSNILVLKDGPINTPAISLYPNPVVCSNGATVLITSVSAATATLTVYDVNGKAVAVKRLPLAAGLNTVSLPMNKLAAGTYFIVYRTADGGLAGKLTFVVAK